MNIRHDQAGLAYIELAFMMPILILLGLGGIELANFAITNSRISQLSLTLADNTSRAKQDVIGGLPQLREYDIKESFLGVKIQSNELDFERYGRAILSSLEVNQDGGQWIHWQRCFGNKAWEPKFGKEGEGARGTGFPGMGVDGQRVTAEPNFAIMFVELVYDYQPIIFGQIIPNKTITKEAAMYVRDRRDLSAGVVPTSGVAPSTC